MVARTRQPSEETAQAGNRAKNALKRWLRESVQSKSKTTAFAEVGPAFSPRSDDSFDDKTAAVHYYPRMPTAFRRDRTFSGPSKEWRRSTREVIRLGSRCDRFRSISHFIGHPAVPIARDGKAAAHFFCAQDRSS